MSGDLRSRWKRTVLRSSLITDSTRVLLLAMHDAMDARGYVSVPRSELALQLGRAERRISERMKDAVEARLLDRVRAGAPGRTAVYRAMLPGGPTDGAR